MIFIEHENSIMRLVRWLEKTTKHQLGLDVVVKTARLQETKAGTRYFIYQCTRYLYNPDTNTFHLMCSALANNVMSLPNKVRD